jgi:bifunctional non-homologous end joining protein LigD
MRSRESSRHRPVELRCSHSCPRNASGVHPPCHPILSPIVPTGPNWFHELKWDGWRIIAHRDADRESHLSRNRRDWAERFPAIVDAIRSLPTTFILDGEAVCLHVDGRPDFQALRSPDACRTAYLIAFDLLEFDGSDLRLLPLHERRSRLAGLIAGASDALRFSGHVDGIREVPFSATPAPSTSKASSRSE